MRLRSTEAVLCSACTAVGYVVLLVTTLTWPQALAFVVIHQAVFGVYLGCSFAPGHKGMQIAGRRTSAGLPAAARC